MNQISGTVRWSVLLAGLLAVAASCSTWAQNQTIHPGPILSSGRVVGNMLFVAGLKGVPEKGKTLADYDITAQSEMGFAAIRNVVEQAGFKMSDIVSVNIYLVDINEIDKMNEVYKKIMPDPKPARVTTEVGHIRSGGRIEISCIVIKQ